MSFVSWGTQAISSGFLLAVATIQELNIYITVYSGSFHLVQALWSRVQFLQFLWCPSPANVNGWTWCQPDGSTFHCSGSKLCSHFSAWVLWSLHRVSTSAWITKRQSKVGGWACFLTVVCSTSLFLFVVRGFQQFLASSDPSRSSY